MSPREKHIKNKAVLKIQSIFRGRKARDWVNNQDQRNFPMSAPVSANFLKGGKRSKEIFLLKKKNLLQNSKDRLTLTKDDWERTKEGVVNKVELERGSGAAKIVKRRLKENKIQRRLDAEALMLHRNLRFIAACIIQNFCKNFVLQKYPHLIPLLKEKRQKEVRTS